MEVQPFTGVSKMRQWHVPTHILCNRHLLGEHVEHHMFVGSINRGISIQGYLEKSLLQPESLHRRHDEIAAEMARRGMWHHSTLLPVLRKFTDQELAYKVDAQSSLQDLISRCPTCRARYEETL